MRRFVIPFLSLIIFWVIFRYGKLIVEGFQYLPHFKTSFFFLSVFSIASLLISSIRLWIIVKKIGYELSVVDCFRIYLMSFGALLSSIKFGDSIQIYLLKRKGLRFSHALLVYSLQRLSDLVTFFLFSLIFLGRRIDLTFFLPLLLFLLVIKFRARILQRLKKWDRFKRIEEEIEIVKEALFNLKDCFFISLLVLSTLGPAFLGGFALSSLTNTNLIVGIEAVIIFGGGSAAVSPTPLGIGVWEIAVSSFLANYIQLPIALSAVLVYRLFFTFIPAFIGLLLFAWP